MGGSAMKIKCFLSVLVAAACISTAVSHAMPFTSEPTEDRFVLPAAFLDGCWLGYYRNAYGGCSRDIYGPFALGIDIVPGPYYAPQCGWRGASRVCNIFGTCWLMCN